LEEKWRGVIIAESLREPSLINEFEVYKARISKGELDLGEGSRGRWHSYWVYATDEQVEKLTGQVKQGWYAHFWKGTKIKAVYAGKRFDFASNDRSTWRSAIEYGKSISISEDELDFPTEN
jgi:hypothetical protein